MTNYAKDKRIVLTLDAGGTNMDFSAMQGFEEVTEHVRLPSNGSDLKLCLQTIEDGFTRLLSSLDSKVEAISFAFPGPADYKQGIIGDLNNLPAFRGGIPLKSILEKKFNLPVHINNDADLFAYGEALGGIVPEINSMLEKAGNPKRYNNLIAVTLGTGFGGGFVSHGELLRGDNSLAGEIWLSSSRLLENINAEEAISIRAVKNEYAIAANLDTENIPEPKAIAMIARGEMKGDRNAAKTSYEKLGSRLGDVLANLITLYDGLVVIGGGIAYAHQLFFPAMMEQFKGSFDIKGRSLPRLVQNIYNLQDETEIEKFLQPDHQLVQWEGIDDLMYNPHPNLAVGVTRLGTRKATSIGAYAYALAQADAISE